MTKKPTTELLLIHNASIKGSLFSLHHPHKSALFTIDENRPCFAKISDMYANTEGADVDSCLSLNLSEESVESGLRVFDQFLSWT